MTTKTDAQRYAAAMISGDFIACTEIEQRNDLFGYPPQLVSIGLKAIEESRDPHEAIDAFIDDAEDEMIEGDDW